MEGYLEIILGPMFAGKTTKLIEKYRECSFLKQNVCVINFEEDKRYDEEMLSSHDLVKINALNLKRLSKLFETEYKNADIFLINEGQFFDDLQEVVKTLVEDMKKSVYIYGLDGDYRREKFGKILDLIPLCNKVKKLTALCNICRDGTKAYFTKRITNETSQKTNSVDSTALVVTETFQAEEKILPNESPDKQYQFATSFLKVGDYSTAERAFREFVDTNPEHNLAGNAQYWYAETFRIRQLYTDAASAYLEGYQRYPKGEKAPINLLKLGVSMVQIGEKDQGCKMINGVEEQYPEANQSVIQKAKYESQKFECNNQNS